MIQVTLSFTSLADAVRALTAMNGTDAAPVGIVTSTGKPQAEKAAAASPSAAPAAAPSSAKTPPPAPAPKAEPAPAAEAPLEYKVLQAEVFDVCKMGPTAEAECRKIPGQFGVATFKEMPEGKRREALAAVQELHAQLKSASEVA